MKEQAAASSTEEKTILVLQKRNRPSQQSNVATFISSLDSPYSLTFFVLSFI